MGNDPRDRLVQCLGDVDQRLALSPNGCNELVHELAVRTAVIASLNAGWKRRARHIGQITRERFEGLAKRSTLVADVRGLGAMIGLELCHDRDPAKPATEAVAAITAACRERGVLVMPAGRNGNVLRILSPLVISDEDLDRGLSAMEDSVLALTDKATA